MKSLKQNIEKARRRLHAFDPRDSLCPVCEREFRTGCNHSAKEARDTLARRLRALEIQQAMRDRFRRYRKNYQSCVIRRLTSRQNNNAQTRRTAGFTLLVNRTLKTMQTRIPYLHKATARRADRSNKKRRQYRTSNRKSHYSHHREMPELQTMEDHFSGYRKNWVSCVRKVHFRRYPEIDQSCVST